MKRCALGLLALLGCALPVMASESGRSLFESKCQACHQANAGGSEALKAPALAGLHASYVSRQITHFRDGLRGASANDPEGQMMAGVAKELTDRQIDVLARYLAGLPSILAAKPPAPQGFSARGIYSSCSSCHGASAEGVEVLGAPRLAGQHTWYLKAQLEKFRQGLRGAHAEDERGQQMRKMAEAVPNDEAIEVIVRYIGQQGR